MNEKLNISLRNPRQLAALLIVVALSPAQAEAAQGAASTYPPCQRGLVEDRCIQLDEFNTGKGAVPRPYVAALAGNHASDTAEAPPAPPGPLGSSPNDPVDTQGPGLIARNARGIDADHADESGSPTPDPQGMPRPDSLPNR